MAFIGNTVQTQGFSPAIDYFNGNGVTVTFTLSRPVASVAQMIVAIDNVIQNPSSAFNVSGSSITFTSAPLSGTNNIWVEYTSLITTYQGISQDPTVIGDIRATGGYLAEGDFGNSFVDGNLIDYVTGRGRFTVGELDDITFYHGGTSGRSEMMDLYYAGGAKIYGTTALTLPVGTTGQRPGTPASGMTRFNTSYGAIEYYNGTSWVLTSTTPTVTASYLIVAGGGGAGNSFGGGGGGGGVVSGTTTLTFGTTYTATVGAGGVYDITGTGGNSSFTGLTTAIGGGVGGGFYVLAGSAGGSGGGGRGGGSPSNGSAGTAGQGNAGGNGGSQAGGGGGGAGAAGVTSGSNLGGAGGAGIASSITGTSIYYAGGGSGSGSGGAQAPQSGGTAQGTAGAANSGAGAGGDANVYGGSGVVIISVPTANYSGTTTGSPTITTSGANTIIKFTSSGTYTA
jgi:hypothetical protein